MKTYRNLLLIAVIGISTGLLLALCTGTEENGLETSQTHEGKGLAEYMYFMQIYTHKVLLSIESENGELAGFYMHELEETAEDIIAHIEEYEGFPVSELTRTILLPVIEELEEELGRDDWERIRNKARVLVNSCNSCHISTDHAFIVITDEASGNPFLQQF